LIKPFRGSENIFPWTCFIFGFFESAGNASKTAL